MSGRAAADPRIARGMERQLQALRARLAAGERRVGWKIALNAPPVQDQLGISAPVVGFLTSAGEAPDRSDLSLAGGTAVGVEAEIAILLSSDVAPGASHEHLSAAIGSLAPAIEIVDIDLPFEDLELILARNVFHRAYLLGAPDAARAGGDLSGVTVRLIRNDREEHTADAEAAVGDPTDPVRLVADLLGECGDRLRAGDVIISGALTPNVWPKDGDRVEADFGALGRLEASFRSAG